MQKSWHDGQARRAEHSPGISEIRRSTLRLRGNKGKEGEGEVGATVALTVLRGPIGLIKHGKNVDMAQGTPSSRRF